MKSTEQIQETLKQESHKSGNTQNSEYEKQILSGTLSALETVFDYSRAVLTGVAEGSSDLVHTTYNVITNPLDEVVYPISSLAFDALIITAAQDYDHSLYSEPNTDDLFMIHEVVQHKPQLYVDAVDRMLGRINSVKEHVSSTAQEFSESSGPRRTEMITKAAFTILAPGYFIKGAKIAENLYRFGIPFNPPKFKPFLKSVVNPAPPIKNLRLSDIRQLKGDDILMYAITDKGKLFIAPRHYPNIIMRDYAGVELPTSFIYHPELARLEPVVAAGDLIVKEGHISKGKIKQSAVVAVDNQAGHYYPRGEHLGKLVETVFRNHGFKEFNRNYFIDITTLPVSKKHWAPSGIPEIIENNIGKYPSVAQLGFGSAIAFNPHEHINQGVPDMSFNISWPYIFSDYDKRSYFDFIPNAQAREIDPDRMNIYNIKKMISEGKDSNNDEANQNRLQEIEKNIDQMLNPENLQHALTTSEKETLEKMLDKLEETSGTSILNSVGNFVDNVNTIVNKEAFSQKYQRNPSDGKNDPIPLMNTLYNVASYIFPKETQRFTQTIGNTNIMLQGANAIRDIFSEKGLSGLLSSGFSIASGNFLSGLFGLVGLFSRKKSQDSREARMIAALGQQIERLHQDVLEGFRHTLKTMHIMDIKFTYRFDRFELMSSSQHSELMQAIHSLHETIYSNRLYLQTIHEAIQRVEQGGNIHEIDKEDWSSELGVMNSQLEIYKETGINRQFFYEKLNELIGILHQSRIKAVNRAKNLIDISNYGDLSRALSLRSQTLGEQASGIFSEYSLDLQYRLSAEQHINLILRYILYRFKNDPTISKTLDPLRKVDLIPKEQFNPIAINEISDKVIKIINLYKLGGFCATYGESDVNCRLNKIEVLEKIKQIRGYCSDFIQTLEILSGKNSNENLASENTGNTGKADIVVGLMEDYIKALKNFHSMGSRLLNLKMMEQHDLDIQKYLNILKQETLELDFQKNQELIISPNIHCTNYGRGSFGDFEWYSIRLCKSWRGRGWNVACQNWAPCGSWHPPHVLSGRARTRYIDERKNFYLGQLEKVKEKHTASNLFQVPEQCKLNYFSPNFNHSNSVENCVKTLFYAYPKHGRGNPEKLLLPIRLDMFKHKPFEQLEPMLQEIQFGMTLGYGLPEFKYSIYEGNKLNVYASWRNPLDLKVLAGSPFFNFKINIPIITGLGIQESLIYFWFGGERPTGDCILYDEGLKRPANLGDKEELRHYCSKGTSWPDGNWVASSNGMRLRVLFLYPQAQTVNGFYDNPQEGNLELVHEAYQVNVNRMISLREKYIRLKRMDFFKKYFYHLLNPDSMMGTELTTLEKEARYALLELDAKATIVKSVLSLVMNNDPSWLSIYGKQSILNNMYLYNGTLLQPLNQIESDLIAFEKLKVKIKEHLSKTSKPAYSSIYENERTLSEFIDEESGHTVSTLEEAIFPKNEEEVINRINPLGQSMAALQTATKIVSKNPEKLKILGPMLQQAHAMLDNALKEHHLLPDSETLEPEEEILEEPDNVLIDLDEENDPDEQKPVQTSAASRHTPWISSVFNLGTRMITAVTSWSLFKTPNENRALSSRVTVHSPENTAETNIPIPKEKMPPETFSTFHQSQGLNDTLITVQYAARMLEKAPILNFSWNKAFDLTQEQEMQLIRQQKKVNELSEIFANKQESRAYKNKVNADQFHDVYVSIKNAGNSIAMALKTKRFSKSELNSIARNIKRAEELMPKLTNKVIEHNIRKAHRKAQLSQKRKDLKFARTGRGCSEALISCKVNSGDPEFERTVLFNYSLCALSQTTLNQSLPLSQTQKSLGSS